MGVVGLGKDIQHDLLFALEFGEAEGVEDAQAAELGAAKLAHERVEEVQSEVAVGGGPENVLEGEIVGGVDRTAIEIDCHDKMTRQMASLLLGIDWLVVIVFRMWGIDPAMVCVCAVG